MAEDIIRVLRVLEYVGPRSIIERHLKDVVHGERQIGSIPTRGSRDPSGQAVVRAATIGLIPDIIEMGKVEHLLPPIGSQPLTGHLFDPLTARRTGGFCAVCSEAQFHTQAGVSCPNGHGGADSI